MQPTLTLAEGVELGYAVVDRAARDCGVRALAIKGRVSERHQLREPRESIDVDVLVEPGGLERLVARLQQAGWSHRANMTLPLVAPFHSVPMRHPVWPNELDLHLRFPGFLADPAATFDALWDERTTIVQATREIPATGLLGSILVTTLHSRRTEGERYEREFDELVAHVEALPEPVELAALERLAAATGALGPAADLFAALGHRVGDEPRASTDPDSVRDWEIRQLGEVRVLHWFEELRRTSPFGWIAVILRALLSNEPELREDYPAAPPGRRGLWIARWWRLRRGLPHLWRAVRLARRPRARS